MQTIRLYKRIALMLLALLMFASLGCTRGETPSATQSIEPVVIATDAPEATAVITPVPQPQLKYIFLFIGDGMGSAQIQTASEALAAGGLSRLVFSIFP
ncbi:MAG: hypothetical protein R2881_06920 [Eubacteriales bacterium]